MLPKKSIELAFALGAVVAVCLAILPELRATDPPVKCNMTTPYICPTCQNLANNTLSCINATSARSIYLCDQNGTLACVVGAEIVCSNGQTVNVACGVSGGTVTGSCQFSKTSC